MSVAITILTIPSGSQLTGAIGADDKNDFKVLILLDGNGTGLTEDGITFSTGASLVELTGSKSVWQATIRPPVTAGTLTITIAANAFTEGNVETSKDIRVSTRFPDDDAESLTQSLPGINAIGITVTPTEIITSTHENNITFLNFYTHAGVEQTSKRISRRGSGIISSPIDFFNGDILSDSSRYRISDFSFIQGGLSPGVSETNEPPGVCHIASGIVGTARINRDRGYNLAIRPYGAIDSSQDMQYTVPHGNNEYKIAQSQDVIYSMFSHSSLGSRFYFIEIIDENEVNFIDLNITSNNVYNRDISIYRDTMYISSAGGIYTLDIRPYRPTALNTKTTIYPVFANEGDTLPLKQFCPDAHTITFGTGFDKPTYLSINADNELEITGNAVTETQPVLVKLTGINYIDSIEFQFYLIILQVSSPTWRDVESLSMKANSTYDLHQIVDADSIAFESGETQPTDSTIANGIFTIATTAGPAYFRATKGGLTTNKTIGIDVIQESNPDNFSDISRFKIEIAGIDVSSDFLSESSLQVTKSLDTVELNQYRADSVLVSLRNNEGKYNPDIAGNFWAHNSLNPGGYQEGIKIYRESFVDDAWISTLLFVGIIENQSERFSAAQVNITAKDISVELERSFISNFGTLSKWAALRQQSDEESYESVYLLENSLSPIQPKTGMAWGDRIAFTLRQLQNPNKGPPLLNTGHLTTDDFRTSGGFLDNPPVLNFKTVPRSEDIRFLFKQLSLEGTIYNTDIQLIDIELDDPTVFNRGSIPFSVENTRITLLPVDWVHDLTNNRLLILLSNPEGHIADLLVQYNIESDSYRVLHTFEKNISTHRITRRNSTDYYILKSKAISQDKSAARFPRVIDSTAFAYDSISEESEIKILRYNASTGTLIDHVDEDNNRPPQLGIHYHIGFENDFYIDEFEGIVADYKGAFKAYNNNIYYRYATPSEFGVARVNTSGTTTKMIDQAALNYHNHLNFAFDVTSGGDIYFVYATGDTATSTLVIKRRTSGGIESTILSETRLIEDFNELGLDFGAFLGCYEALFHNNNLYIFAPIQAVDQGEESENPTADPDFIIERADTGMRGERYVTTSTNLNPISRRLAPGDDIPIRIDFNDGISGATQSDLTVIGGVIQSFSISSDMIDITIRPDDLTRHKNIVIDLAQNAVTQNNEATRIIIDFGTRRSREKSSGMALYKCNVTASRPALTIIEKWDFATQGGCNLIVHDGNVHYTEHPVSASQFKPINPDLDTYNANMKYNIIPDAIGALKKIDNSDNVESLGNLWYTERAYNRSIARALSFDDELHLIMGYGNTNEVLRYNSLASKADNFVHLVFGNKLNYILPTFSPDGNVYSKLATIARQVGATLRFDGNIISIVGRRAFRAKANGETGTDTGNFDFDSENKAFPLTGYLRIADEFIGYTGIISGAFTGITRGALGSEIVNHVNEAGILYLDALIFERDILQINGQTDTTRHANIIRDNKNLFEVKDDANIAKYRRQPYTLDLGLTHNEDAWIETLFEKYLSELKNLGKVFNMRLRPGKKTSALDLGQLVGLQYGLIAYALRIETITYHSNFVDIKARSVATDLG